MTEGYDIFAYKGDVLTCVNHHAVLEFRETVKHNQPVKAKHFYPIGGFPMPVPGEEVPKCPICGGRVIFDQQFIRKSQ